MNKSCKGCATYEYDDIDYESGGTTCRYRDYNNKGQCPCTNCVIKMMCDVDCPMFREFTESVDAIIKDKGRPWPLKKIVKDV